MDIVYERDFERKTHQYYVNLYYSDWAVIKLGQIQNYGKLRFYYEIILIFYFQFSTEYALL